MEKSFGLFFFLKKNKWNQPGQEIDVYLKITVNGKSTEISSKRKCDPSKWNALAGKVVGQTEYAKAINSYLDVLKRKVYDYRKQLEDANFPVNVESIKHLLKGGDITGKKYMLMQIFKQHNEQMRALVGQEYAISTVIRYETAYRHTQNFLLSIYKVKDLDITQLDYEFMAEYEFWLKSVRKCDHNSAMKYLTNFKKIVLRCLKNGWLKQDPFINFKLTKREVERSFCALNIGDLNILPKDKIQEQIAGIFAKKIVYPYYKHKTAGNYIRDVLVLTTPMKLKNKKLNFAIIHDVTELKIREEESNKFKKTADIAIPFIGFANMQREVTYFNKSMKLAFAVPDNAILNKYTVYDFYSEKGKKKIKEIHNKILESGYWEGENEMQSLDGRIYQVLQTVVLIRDGTGQPQFTSSTAIDITNQKRDQQEITSIALRYRTLMENAGEGIHIVDSNLKLIEANEAFCKMLGYNKEEILKLSITDWDVQWDKEALMSRVFQPKRKLDIFETKHKRKDGTIIDVEINAKAIFINNQEFLYASSRDITQRKLLEKKLQHSELNLRSILENSFDAIGVHVNGIWQMCNQAAIKLFGYSSPEELIGSSILGVVHPSEHQKINSNIKKRVGDKVRHENYITKGLRKDGSVFDMEVSLSSFLQNNQVNVSVILKDITEKRKKDAEILNLNAELRELTAHLQKIRVDERNKLAKEVHDKLGQSLVGVKFNLDFLNKEFAKNNPAILNKYESISADINALLHNFIQIYSEVNPALIQDFELYDAVSHLVIDQTIKDDLKIKLNTNIENLILDYEIKWVIYKTVQEYLLNILQSSNAKEVEINLNKKGNLIILEIHDDGTGFEVSKLDYKKQLGILEIRELIIEAKGNINISSTKRNGTLIKATVPI